MTKVVVGKWGKARRCGFRASSVSKARLMEGGRVGVEARDADIVIRQVAPRFTLAELLKGKSPQDWREAYADVF